MLPKVRGYVYACNNQLYRQVKKNGVVRYLKCCVDNCDGSAKINNGESLQPNPDDDSSDEDEDTLQAPTSGSSSAATVVSATDDSVPQPRCCEVCLTAPIEGFALVPCGHARFCERCARTVADMGGNCPICRSSIHMVMRVFA